MKIKYKKPVILFAVTLCMLSTQCFCVMASDDGIYYDWVGKYRNFRDDDELDFFGFEDPCDEKFTVKPMFLLPDGNQSKAPCEGVAIYMTGDYTDSLIDPSKCDTDIDRASQYVLLNGLSDAAYGFCRNSIYSCGDTLVDYYITAMALRILSGESDVTLADIKEAGWSNIEVFEAITYLVTDALYYESEDGKNTLSSKEYISGDLTSGSGFHIEPQRGDWQSSAYCGINGFISPVYKIFGEYCDACYSISSPTLRRIPEDDLLPEGDFRLFVSADDMASLSEKSFEVELDAHPVTFTPCRAVFDSRVEGLFLRRQADAKTQKTKIKIVLPSPETKEIQKETYKAVSALVR